ncbi:uncharacterized protein TRIVIDRAFT_221169 [Trichoderma virens Gv29-8]|uniref:Fungal N-terminal domain-containing protein n=1 Tax=Hypocrea virens (strain Gv29-8 / FGSC 10586) TaxID=413071 RepID=G9MPX2_HYPVG|nr:uncharacterized protein TRIVIDRAFT_221169 [Trichoderma virens Gv29-8]EHK23922.1 hypothetical protein TRIVIDRAFT_221169 [Trichoderma virens Gv29-8]UKZ50226.1 hypothetical protein TrVGV298_004484 [Trichoderma virens]
MAQVLIPIVGITLAEAGKSLGLAGISWAGTKVFQAVADAVVEKTDPNEAVKRKLETALGELGKIKTSIHDLSVQIRDLRIETKVDQLQTQVDNIEALYDQYTNAAAALAKAAETHASNPHQYQQCVHRCTDVGKQVIKDVYPALKHINTALVEQGEQSLLHLLHTAHVNDNKDFLAQYCMLKAALLKYFLIEVKAMVLFDLAKQDDTVEFGTYEYEGTMKKVWDMVEAQQNKFDSLLHVNVRRLAEYMCKNGNEKTFITLRSHNGTNIGRGLLVWQTKASMLNWVVRPIISPGYRWILARFGAGDEPRADYGHQSRPDPPLDDATMSGEHWFSITADILGPDCRSLSGGNGVDNVPTKSWSVSACRYKLHPTPEGLFRLEYGMQFASGAGDHTFLEVGDDGLLHDRYQANVNEPRQKFQIELWDMSKPYDPEAKSPEQHDLEGDNGYWKKPKKDEGGCILM